jgi:hypothetical protein
MFCVAWGICGVLGLAVKCNPAEPWITVAADCPNIVRDVSALVRITTLTGSQLLRWQIISAFEVVIEVSIFAVIIGLVYKLQMALTKKFAAVFGFAFRLPYVLHTSTETYANCGAIRLIALTTLHLHEVRDTISSTNPTFDYIPASAIMSIQLGWSLVSATIVRLKSFVENLGSGYLGATLNTSLGSFAGTGSENASRDARRGGARDDAFEMQAVRRAETASNSRSPYLKSNNPPLVDDNASIGSMTRVSNDGSQELMVRKRKEET